MRHSLGEEIASLVGYQPSTANHTLLANTIGHLIRTQIVEPIEAKMADCYSHEKSAGYLEALKIVKGII